MPESFSLVPRWQPIDIDTLHLPTLFETFRFGPILKDRSAVVEELIAHQNDEEFERLFGPDGVVEQELARIDCFTSEAYEKFTRWYNARHAGRRLSRRRLNSQQRAQALNMFFGRGK